MVVCAAVIAAAALATRATSIPLRVGALAGAMLLCVAAAAAWRHRFDSALHEERLASFRPSDLTADASSPYAGSKACRSCHPQEWQSWQKSYHRSMTQAVHSGSAAAGSVQANFDDVVL